jgi:hypothetical protein
MVFLAVTKGYVAYTGRRRDEEISMDSTDPLDRTAVAVVVVVVVVVECLRRWSPTK